MSYRGISAIDIGTNSVRLLVGRIDGPSFRRIHGDISITRLGEGLDEKGILRRDRMEATLDTVVRFTETALRFGSGPPFVFATAAVREAGNGVEFVRMARERTGMDIAVLSGEEEAEAAFLGATFEIEIEGETVVFDIGGGSTEFVLATGGEVSESLSLPLGSVRMNERHIRSDPPAPEEILRLDADISSLLDSLPSSTFDSPTLIGVAGTVTQLAALELALPEYDPERVQGLPLSAAMVSDWRERLSKMPVSERKGLPGMDPGRADVIVAGAAILLGIMSRFKADGIIASDNDSLLGVLLKAGIK